MSRWETITQQIFDTYSYMCNLCGRRLSRQVWKVDYRGEELDFCNEDCERLWFDYWLPKYGKKATPEENSK